MAAVIAIASAPQNVTRSAPAAIGAPPARAATPPSTASDTSDDARDQRDGVRRGASGRDRERQRGAGREASGRGERGLDRPRALRRRDAELVARVRAERVVLHELVRDLAREMRVEPAADVDRR